jgi:Glycosyl transferase family group 2
MTALQDDPDVFPGVLVLLGIVAAMNLNSYIGLMGGRYRDVRTPAGRSLVPAAEFDASDLVVPHSDYILTLDADSVILPEYCLRLVHLLEQTEHKRDGVAQSPCSAFRGAATRLERIAGATTDLQHIIHQGMTFYGASFWVGAMPSCARRRSTTSLRPNMSGAGRFAATSRTEP